MTDARVPIFQARSLSYSYSATIRALNGVDLDIHRGELVAVIGQNGSGKSTLARLINGMLRIPGSDRESQLLLRDRNGREWDVRRTPVRKLSRIVGYVFQNPDRQIFTETVNDELHFGLRNIGVRGPEAEERVRDTLELLGLNGRGAENPFRVSRGDRQRIAIASVLVMDPELVVVDEPTTGQDYLQAHMVMDTLQRYQGSGHTLLVITHNMELVAEYAERVILLGQGRVLADGTPCEVFAQEEVLRSSHVKPPQITQLGMGLGFGATLTIDELARGVAGACGYPNGR